MPWALCSGHESRTRRGCELRVAKGSSCRSPRRPRWPAQKARRPRPLRTPRCAPAPRRARRRVDRRWSSANPARPPAQKGRGSPGVGAARRGLASVFVRPERSFDDLARALAEPMPRRRAVRVIGASLVAIAVPGISPPGARAGRVTRAQTCAPGQLRCTDDRPHREFDFYCCGPWPSVCGPVIGPGAASAQPNAPVGTPFCRRTRSPVSRQSDIPTARRSDTTAASSRTGSAIQTMSISASRTAD